MPLALTWESFRDSYVRPGIPAVHAVGGSEQARLFVDIGANRVGLWLQIDSTKIELPKSGRTLAIRILKSPDGPVLEIATQVKPLFEQFYALAADVLARVDSGMSPEAASSTAIQAWRDLLDEHGSLSPAEELGLWGELWFLDWLVKRGIQVGVAGWTGPLGDPHDFRFGALEVEVKTTTSAKRHHTINSLEQLATPPGRDLFVLSLLVGEAGAEAGKTLTELIVELRGRLSEQSRHELDGSLSRAGYREEDTELYRRRFVLRSNPAWIAVNSDFPVLGRAELGRGCGSASAALIIGATYEVNLEGMGIDLEHVLTFKS